MAAEFTKAEEVVRRAKPGDLIEFKRRLYKHWGIYVGDGDIVHFASNPTASPLNKKKALVKHEKLTEAAGSHLCRVNNRLDKKYPPRDPKLIVSDALLMIGEEVEYSVETWNCEHFVTGLRYYKSESGQVEKVTLVGLLALGATLLASLIGIVVTSNKTEKKQQQ